MGYKGRYSRGVLFAVGGLLAVMTLSSSGCVMPAGSMRYTESHFVYPNSNVVPTGTVGKGSNGVLCGFIIPWDGFTAEIQEEAYQRAIRAGGGDILINGFQHQYVRDFMILGLRTCTTEVTGQGAKMQVGKQELR